MDLHKEGLESFLDLVGPSSIWGQAPPVPGDVQALAEQNFLGYVSLQAPVGRLIFAP